MGRVKKYSKQFSNRNKAKHSKMLRLQEQGEDVDMNNDRNALSVQKRKQIFKKKDRRDLKLKIKELRARSLKLKKKDIN